MSLNRTKISLIVPVLILTVIGVCYIYYSWIFGLQGTKEQAVKLSDTVKAGLLLENVQKLHAEEADIQTKEYVNIKEYLKEIVAIHNDIRFSYLYTQRDGKLYFMVDSEPETSADYSPAGQEYSEATKIYYRAMRGESPIITPEYRDRWGSWISVLSPIKDPETGKVIAVFAMDYSPDRWFYYTRQNTLLLSAVIICIILLFASATRIFIINSELRKDKSKIIKINKELEDSERSLSIILSNLPGMAYRCNYDRDWTMKFVSAGCYEITGYYPQDLIDNKKVSFNDIIDPEQRERLCRNWEKILANKTIFKDEYQIKTASGEMKWVYEQGQGIYNEDQEVESLEGLIIDITERKNREEEINFLSNHDTLTGIYNRRFFDDKKWQLDLELKYPLSVIIGDIDGLKLINDSLGHTMGDKLIITISQILNSFCRKEDVLARTGGDEFCFLLPFTEFNEAEIIMKQIEATCMEWNRKQLEEFPISISLGCATKHNTSELMNIVLKEAEDNMYRHKMLQSRSLHSAFINSMNSTLFEKSQETQEHAQRLIELSNQIGRRMKLNDKQLNELELLSRLHDIGKIGISDVILNKPDRLTEDEWIEMKKHPEIGYRIAMSTPELTPIAEYILYHHERWDGKGYPIGLKGEEIPLLSRIIMLADSYDAMTSDRAYRKAMTKEQALEELKKCAGTQFDPEIALIFIDNIEKDN